MNERIRELVKQAGFSFKYKTVPDELNPGHKLQDLEKFAELIVRECINCCDDIDAIQKHYLKYGIDQELGASQCIEVIKKHFGVKE